MTYAERRRQSAVLYLLAALMLLPPGAFRGGVQAASRTATLSRLSALETFRNPQFSGGANRFLSGQSASAFVGGGGNSLSNPDARGYRRDNSPLGIWLPTGKLEWAEADLRLPGVGMPLDFQRMSRGSVTGYDGPLGEGWDFNWNVRLKEDVDNDVALYEMGRVEIYNETTGTYATPAGRYDTLAKDTAPDPDIFTLTDKFGVVETFEDEGSGWYRLTEIEDRSGNTITFAYDTSSQLTKVTDTLSQDTTLAYDLSGRITKITDPHSREWVYGYDSGTLTSVRTPVVDESDNDHDFLSGKTRSYAYDASTRLTSVTWPAGHVLSVGYGGSGKITSQTVNGNAYTIAYGTTGGGAAYVEVDDREGLADNRYYYDQTTDLVTRREIEVTSGHDTTYTYNSDAEVTLVTFPNGNRLAYSYDDDGNITKLQHQKDSGDTTSPVEWSWAYGANNLMTSLTDPNGRTWTYARDADGNVTRKTWPAVTVPSGIASTDSNGNSVNDGTIVEDYEYTAAGLLTKVTDPYGTDTDYEYSQVNSTDAYLQRVIRDPSGLALTTVYAVDGRGNVTSVTDPEGNATTYSYNDLDQVLVTAEPLSVTRTSYYDGDDRVTKTTVTNDTDVGNSLFTTNTLYDAYGNVTTVIADVDGTSTRLTTTMAYDDNDWLTKRVSPGGVETRFVYDERGLRTSTVQELGATDAVSVTVYDDNGNRITSTDPLGNDTVYEYDALDRLTQVTTAEGHDTEYAHDKAGNVTKVSRYNNQSPADLLAETTTSYDEANRVYKTERMAKKADLSTNLGDGQQTKTVWRDERGAVLEYTDDICGCSAFTYTYDAIGRRVTTEDPMPGSQQNTVIVAHDKNGRVTKTTRKEKTQKSGIEGHKDIVVESVYDARGRQVTRRDKRAASTYSDTVRLYGKRDQLTKVTDADGDVTLYEYNEQLWRTEVTAETAGDDVVTQFVHDSDGRVVTYRAKNSTTGDQETIYSYDALGRRVTTEWPDGGETIQTYDLAGQRVSTTDPIGTVAVRTYDDDRRLTAIDLTLATNVKGVTALDYGVDGLGRITSADTAEASGFTTVVERDYNTLGKLESETQIVDAYNSGNGRTITYDWNVAGQKTGVTYPVSGDVIEYDRDDLDRVDAITREGSQVVDYAFNGSRVIEKAFPGSAAEMTYDGFGRLTQILHVDSSSSNTLLQLDYGYDDSHRVTHLDKLFYDDVQNTRITAATEDLGDQYAYDGAGRLVTVLRGVPTAKIGTAMATNITNGDYDDLVEYEYDQTGNRVTTQVDGTDDTVYEHNTVNEMTKEDTSTLAYDANGNFEGASNAYKYNWQNQLETYTVGPATFTWHHDAFGRTVQRDRTSSTASNRKYFDGVNVIESVSFESTTGVETHKKTWVYGERPDEMLLYVDVAATPDDEYYAHADRLGSVMLLVDDTGAIQESYRYTEWGEHTILDDTFTALSFGTNSPVGNAVLYTGQRWARTAEGSTGGSGMTWFDYKARHYRADAGRFVQRDPAGYSDGPQLYAYVRSRPLVFIDPSGTTTVLPGFTDDDDLIREPLRPDSSAAPKDDGLMGPILPPKCVQDCYKYKAEVAEEPEHMLPACGSMSLWIAQEFVEQSNCGPQECDVFIYDILIGDGLIWSGDEHDGDLTGYPQCCKDAWSKALIDDGLSDPAYMSLRAECLAGMEYWEDLDCWDFCGEQHPFD